MRSNTTPHQRALNLAAEKAEAREAVAAKRAEEDAIWEAEGRRVAQRVIAEQVAAMEDHILDALRESAHNDRSNLVNLYVGADRKERLAETDMILGAIEEEQAKRAGLASSEDILASFAEGFAQTVTAEHPAIQAAMSRKEQRAAL